MISYMLLTFFASVFVFYVLQKEQKTRQYMADAQFRALMISFEEKAMNSNTFKMSYFGDKK